MYNKYNSQQKTKKEKEKRRSSFPRMKIKLQKNIKTNKENKIQHIKVHARRNNSSLQFAKIKTKRSFEPLCCGPSLLTTEAVKRWCTVVRPDDSSIQLVTVRCSVFDRNRVAVVALLMYDDAGGYRTARFSLLLATSRPGRWETTYYRCGHASHPRA